MIIMVAMYVHMYVHACIVLILLGENFEVIFYAIIIFVRTLPVMFSQRGNYTKGDSYSNSLTSILITGVISYTLRINCVSRNIRVKIISYSACFTKLKRLEY